MEVRFKHRLIYRDVTKKRDDEWGDVLSYDDSSNYRLSSKLTLQDTRIETFPQFKKEDVTESFHLTFSPEKCPKLHGYVSYLIKSPHKAGLLYFDSAGSYGLAFPSDMHNSHGLKVYILKFKRPPEQSTNIHDHVSNYGIAADYGIATGTKRSRNTMEVNVAPYVKQPQQYQPSSVKLGAEQQAAASHYNDLKRERATRHVSHIFHMRNLNNFIKMEIIDKAMRQSKLHYVNALGIVPKGVTVLDFGCGMGGDILKWLKNPVGLARYVGVDIARNSLQHFISERLVKAYQQHQHHQQHSELQHHKVTQIICADIGSESLTESQLECFTWTPEVGPVSGSWDRRVPLQHPSCSLADQFDIASCQFAIHYMFQSERKAHHFFEQVSNHLKPGGIFIATTIDCRVLVEYLLQTVHGKLDLDADYNAGLASDPAAVALGAAGQDVSAEAPAGGIGGGGDSNTLRSRQGQEDAFAAVREALRKRRKVTFGSEIDNGQRILQFKNDVGQTVLRIIFERGMWNRLIPGYSEQHQQDGLAEVHGNGNRDRNPVSNDPYGIQYTFTLLDSSSSSDDGDGEGDSAAAVNAPEWVVPLGPPLQRLAAAHGMRLAETQNFQGMVQQAMNEGPKLQKMDGMHVFNHKGTLSQAEWDITRLYVRLEFQKIEADEVEEQEEEEDKVRGVDWTDNSTGAPHTSVNSGKVKFATSATCSKEGPPNTTVEHALSSPDGPPPPMFAPGSPDGPPPPVFAPGSPDGPPPSVLAPGSPERPPPPVFAPGSPDGPPPPVFAPGSPEGPPPPVFAPGSPEGPPPTQPAAAMPSIYDSDSNDAGYGAASGERAAATAASVSTVPMNTAAQVGAIADGGVGGLVAPSKGMYDSSSDEEGWEGPEKAGGGGYEDEENEEDGDGMDAAMQHMMRIRERAIQLAGGDDAWDALSEEAADALTDQARQQLADASSSGVNVTSKDVHSKLTIIITPNR